MKLGNVVRLLAAWGMLCLTATAARALDVDITGITLGPAPLEVQIAVQTDQTGLPMSAFSVTENGVPMTLDTLTCGIETLNPVDVVFVIDRSRSMEDNIDSVAANLIGWIQKPARQPRFPLRPRALRTGSRAHRRLRSHQLCRQPEKRNHRQPDARADHRQPPARHRAADPGRRPGTRLPRHAVRPAGHRLAARRAEIRGARLRRRTTTPASGMVRFPTFPKPR